jgi:molybdate transport system ATP-binding protein
VHRRIETPDEGRIVLDGRVLFDSKKNISLSPQERRVGYLFQQYALFPSMSVAQTSLPVSGRETRRRGVRSFRRK